ncbi:RNA helicase [Didymella heteroderae]|uniref:RNA helicase n=1 Tax=Didymella heteroderae TaxID=1769908 RepID=A0A9P4WIR9_9PLEO|nr:RNA helicase [Didymella heteroderae]
MLRQTTRVCALCEVRSLLNAARRPVPVPVPVPVPAPVPAQSRLYSQVQGERLPPRSRPPPRERDGPSRGRDGASFNTRLGAPSGRGRGRDDAERSRQRPTYGRDTLQLSGSVDRAAGDRPKRKPREPYSFLNKTRAPPTLLREREQQARERGPDRDMNPRGRDGDKRRTKPDAFHALKMQRSLHEIPYASRKAVKGKLEQYDAFDKFPLLDTVQAAVKDALPDLEYRNPTPAQAVAIPALLGLRKEKRTRTASKKSSGPDAFLLAAETGSGKTLAYLLPTLDAIKREEAQEKEEEEEAAAQAASAEAASSPVQKRGDMFDVPEPTVNKAVDPARPRAIILVPSAELVAQVGAVAKSLSHTIKFRAAPISAKMSATVIRNRLFNEHGVDVVISTPPLLASIAESNPNILARVTHLICDEADSLFDRSFKPATTEILDRATPSLKKLVLCSATIPKYLDKFLSDKFPDMTRLVTPNLHAIPRRVQLGVVDVNKDPYRGNKMLACADSIWQIGKSSSEYNDEEGKESVNTKRILVFVNEREDTGAVAEYLCKKGIDALAFHRDTDPVRQAKTLASFTDGSISPSFGQKKDMAEHDADEGTTKATTSRTLANTKVIVTTDLGSRGIDTVSVRHVILYDVPHTTIDFIHRLGRTGRMGRRGRGIVLLGAGDRADVVREVREAMFRGEALI